MSAELSELPPAASRAAQAVQRARSTVAVSHRLRACSRYARELGGLARRCAWCGRYEIGSSWLDADELPAFLDPREDSLYGRGITHGICADCFERENGRAREARRSRAS